MPGDAWPVQPRAWGLEHGGASRRAPDRPVPLSASGDTGEDYSRSCLTWRSSPVSGSSTRSGRPISWSTDTP